MTPAQFYFGISILSILVLVGVLLNNQRLNDLRSEMIARIDGLRDTLRAEMAQLGAELRAEMARQVSGLQGEMARNHAELVSRITELETRVQRVT